MKSILLKSLAGAGLLAFSLASVSVANAQDRDRDFYGNRDAYFHGEHWHARMFQRVKEDVEHVRADTWPQGGDTYRLDRTVDELNQLQSNMASHVYDENDLNRVIGTLNRVVSDNRMSPSDRNILTDDVSRLQDFRAHHADWDR